MNRAFDFHIARIYFLSPNSISKILGGEVMLLRTRVVQNQLIAFACFKGEAIGDKSEFIRLIAQMNSHFGGRLLTGGSLGDRIRTRNNQPKQSSQQPTNNEFQLATIV
jgi:hypothetical protein